MGLYFDCDESFDGEFEKIASIKFLPFIGEGYSSAHPKIMVLGESTYWDKDDYVKECIRNNMYDYLESLRDDGSTPRWANATAFRKMAAIITGKGSKESDEIWYNLAFYDFCQITIGKTAPDKSNLTKEALEMSQEAYLEVIKILNPNLIIAWGTSDLYHWVPQNGKIGINESEKLYKYEMFPNTFIWHINHPAKGFNFSLAEWQEKYAEIKKYLN